MKRRIIIGLLLILVTYILWTVLLPKANSDLSLLLFGGGGCVTGFFALLYLIKT